MVIQTYKIPPRIVCFSYEYLYSSEPMNWSSGLLFSRICKEVLKGLIFSDRLRGDTSISGRNLPVIFSD